jgi:hypothetical protein
VAEVTADPADAATRLRPVTTDTMLGQLQVVPGQRVLEIGSGGYNAALLRFACVRTRGSRLLTVHPADTPDADLPSGLVTDSRHTRIVISWPDHHAR